MEIQAFWSITKNKDTHDSDVIRGIYLNLPNTY